MAKARPAGAGGRLGPTFPARPSPTAPEWRQGAPEFCGRGREGPGVRVELGLTRGGAGGGAGLRRPQARGLRKRSVGAAPARGAGAPTARGRGLRPDGAAGPLCEVAAAGYRAWLGARRPSAVSGLGDLLECVKFLLEFMICLTGQSLQVLRSSSVPRMRAGERPVACDAAEELRC